MLSIGGILEDFCLFCISCLIFPTFAESPHKRFYLRMRCSITRFLAVMSIVSDELNFLVYRYLQESGKQRL